MSIRKYLDEAGLRVLAENIGGGGSGNSQANPKIIFASNPSIAIDMGNKTFYGKDILFDAASAGDYVVLIKNNKQVKAPDGGYLEYQHGDVYKIQKVNENVVYLGDYVTNIGGSSNNAPVKLWEGNWVSGSITVPGVSNYMVLIARSEGINFQPFMVKDLLYQHYASMGVYLPGESTSSKIYGAIWQMLSNNPDILIAYTTRGSQKYSAAHSSNTNLGAAGTIPINEIWGVF